MNQPSCDAVLQRDTSLPLSRSSTQKLQQYIIYITVEDSQTTLHAVLNESMEDQIMDSAAPMAVAKFRNHELTEDRGIYGVTPDFLSPESESSVNN